MPCNNAHVEVYRSGIDKPIQRVKYSIAKRLVSEGRAEFTEKKAIRLISRRVVAVSSFLVTTNQGAAYELAGIGKHLQYFSGGLVRTEHQPLQIRKCKGARVGHQ